MNKKLKNISLRIVFVVLIMFLVSCNSQTNNEKENLEGQENSIEIEGEDNMEANNELNFVLAKDIPKGEEAFFYSNPSRINGIGDPFIIRDYKTGVYTAIATSASIGFYGWDSEDLVNWGSKHWVYQRPENTWSTDSYWAPEVVFYNDAYYMFYTARDKSGRLLISVAKSDSAAGPYEDVSPEKPVFDFGYAIIDASVFVDDDGRAYMYYAKDVSENIIMNGKHVSQIYGVELSEDLLSIKGEPVLLTSPDSAWENPQESWSWNEGPIVLKHNNEYYLAYSANMFESPAYSVGYAKSANPLGPYEKAQENPILATKQLEGISGSGHHSYFNSPDGTELFTAYHTHTVPQKPSGNRQLAIDRALYTEDGKFVVNGPTESYLPAPANDKQRVLLGSEISDIQLSEAATALSEASGDDASSLELAKLFDGILSIHPDQKVNDVNIQTEADGNIEIKITLQEEHNLAAICLVSSSQKDNNIANISLKINDKVSNLGELEGTNPRNHTLAGKFDPITSNEIVLIIEPKDASSPISLSEIYISEKLN